jgi:hypothetical protein
MAGVIATEDVKRAIPGGSGTAGFRDNDLENIFG